MSAYCPTCRVDFVQQETPPYAAAHRLDGGGFVHYHPITGQELVPVTNREET